MQPQQKDFLMANAGVKSDDFLHFSQLKTFWDCRKRHDYAYIERLEPQQYFARMSNGTLGHARLEDLLKGADEHNSAFSGAVDSLFAQQEAGTLDETVDIKAVASEMRAIADRAYKVFDRRFQLFDDHVEKSMVVVLDSTRHPVDSTLNGVKLGGTPDAVVRDRSDGSIWLIDWKFRKTFLAPESEYYNAQMIFYTWLLQETHGILPVGSRQIQITPHLPKQPKLTKSGEMSRADIKTDWDTYSAALTQAALDPADYAEMQTKLATKNFIDMDSCRAMRNLDEITYYMTHDILPTVAEIQQRKAQEALFGPGFLKGGRVFDSMKCGMCAYRELCTEEAKNGDVDWIRDHRFRPKGSNSSFALPIFSFVESEE